MSCQVAIYVHAVHYLHLNCKQLHVYTMCTFTHTHVECVHRAYFDIHWTPLTHARTRTHTHTPTPPPTHPHTHTHTQVRTFHPSMLSCHLPILPIFSNLLLPSLICMATCLIVSTAASTCDLSGWSSLVYFNNSCEGGGKRERGREINNIQSYHIAVEWFQERVL